MSTSIKPQFFASWIPIGEIKFVPKIFASVVYTPHLEKVNFDTSRNISKLENISADTFRKTGNVETTRADLKRAIKNIENVFADTSRKIGVESSSADTCRAIKNISSASADTFRKISNSENSFADSFRKIAAVEKISADTFLQVKKTEKATADTLRGLREKTSANTFRKVLRPEKVFANTVIRYPHVLNFFAQVNTFKDYDVTAFNVTLGERTLSDSFTFETAQQIHINDAVKGQFLDYHFSFLVEEITEQDFIFSVKGMYDFDKLLYSYYTHVGTLYLSQGEAKLYSDKGYIVQELIHYPSGNSPRVAYCKASDIITKAADYLGLTPVIHFDDFTPTNLTENTTMTYQSLLRTLFGWSSQIPQRQINVFIRGNNLFVIQRSCEDSIFDISDIPHSRPKVNKKLVRTMYQKQKYEAGEVLENSGDNKSDGDDSNFDGDTDNDQDSEKDPLEPYYDDKDIQTPFSGTIGYKSPYGYAQLIYSYGLLISQSAGLKTNKTLANNSTDYEYDYLGGAFYLTKKFAKSTTITYEGNREITIDGHTFGGGDSFSSTPTKIVTKSITHCTYRYSGDGIYLFEEYEGNFKQEFFYRKGETENDGTWILTNEETDERVTNHFPLGDSWYATSVFLNGEPQGTSISRGTPGSKISQYTINQTQKVLKSLNKGNSPESNNGGSDGGDSGSSDGGDTSGDSARTLIDAVANLNPINGDVSFPVMERDLLVALVNSYYELNRKTQITVSVDLISEVKNGLPVLKHVVDFTERVKLDGEEYFLVSNNVSLTPRKFVQRLQLVRWSD